MNPEDKYPVFNLEIIKTKVPTYSSAKLCEMIVCERYIGFHPDVTTLCMEELSRRRINGDNFDFESYINQAFNSLPKLDFTIPDIRTVLSQLVKK
jgi:hypothetical protein